MNAGACNDGFNAKILLFLHLYKLQPALFHFKVCQEPAGNSLCANNLDLQPFDQEQTISAEDIDFPLYVFLAATVLKAGTVQPADTDIGG